MENLQISSKEERRCIRRCGTAVLYAYAPIVTGETPAARHMAAMIEALLTYTETALAASAETALREAAAQKKLLHFTPHTVKISLEGSAAQGTLCLTLGFLYQNGDAVLRKSKLCTCWSPDQKIQYRRCRPKKNLTFFARSLARARKM